MADGILGGVGRGATAVLRSSVEHVSDDTARSEIGPVELMLEVISFLSITEKDHCCPLVVVRVMLIQRPTVFLSFSDCF